MFNLKCSSHCGFTLFHYSVTTLTPWRALDCLVCTALTHSSLWVLFWWSCAVQDGQMFSRSPYGVVFAVSVLWTKRLSRSYAALPPSKRLAGKDNSILHSVDPLLTTSKPLLFLKSSLWSHNVLEGIMSKFRKMCNTYCTWWHWTTYSICCLLVEQLLQWSVKYRANYSSIFSHYTLTVKLQLSCLKITWIIDILT